MGDLLDKVNQKNDPVEKSRNLGQGMEMNSKVFNENKQVLDSTEVKYKYFPNTYSLANENIQRFKSLMKLELANEPKIIIDKITSFKHCFLEYSLHEELKTLSVMTGKANISFYELLKERVEALNNLYITIHFSLEKYKNLNLSKVHLSYQEDILPQITSTKAYLDKVVLTQKLYENEIALIKNFMSRFSSSNNNESYTKNDIPLDNYEELQVFYEQNLTIIKKSFLFSDYRTFLSFVNSLTQLRTYFEGRNQVNEILSEVIKAIVNVYMIVLDSLVSYNKDIRFDIILELEEFFVRNVKKCFVQYLEKKLQIIMNSIS